MTTKLAFNQIGNNIANVKDYGAVGDGVTDDTLAINAAKSAASHIYFPPGTYIVRENGGAACIALKSNVTFFGAGIGISIIKRQDNDVNSSRIMYGVGVENVTIMDLTLDGNMANQNAAYEQQHAFMVTRAGAGLGSKNIKLTRVECKDTVGDGFFFHLESQNCHMTDCVADNNLRVGANVGFVRGCMIKGCVFSNIRTNGIKTEPNDPGDIARNITITGNTFSAPNPPTSTLGGVTLGSPTTAEVNGITIVGNTFYNLDFPVLLSKAAKNVVVSGNTMRNCRSMVRALSFTSALGDIQENILVENNVGYDLLHIGTSDQYLFAFYNAKNVVCRNNIATQSTGGILARYGDFRECDDVTFSGNRIVGDNTFTALSFLNCERIEVKENTLSSVTSGKDFISIDNTTAPTIPLVYADIKDNVFLGTYRYGINLSSVSDLNTIDERSNRYLGTFTAKRLGATAAKYVNLYDGGNFSVTSGTGAPSGAPLGDRGMYIREDGGTTTTLYIWEGAAWVAK